MTANLTTLEKEALARISAAKSAVDLTKVEKEYFGRKSGLLTNAMQELKSLSAEEKKKQGVQLNIVKKVLEDSIKEKQKSFEQEKLGALASEDTLDVTMDLPERERGHLHLVPEFIRQIEEVFGRMGFDVAYGPEIDTEEYNFDLLNFPKDHASREAQDIFYMKDPGSAVSSRQSADPATPGKRGSPENRRLLRGHTSTVQIRYAKTHKPPFRMICPGKTYRKDADATHSPMFHQFEGMMIGKDISMRHLKGVLVQAMRELISPDIDFRWRTGYFPFTEPSLEMDIKWRGDRETKEGQWLEMGGCGMTHPNVLRNVGIDPDEWQGYAFGFGVERPLMIKHQIPSIRLFYQGDLRFLRQW